MTLIKTFTPYLKVFFISVAMLLATPSRFSSSKVVIIPRALVIQTTKTDPPRIAFDQINANRKPSSESAPHKRDGTEINLNQIILGGEKAIQAIRERKILLQQMVVARQEALQMIEQEKQIKQQQLIAQAEKNRIEAEDQSLVDKLRKRMLFGDSDENQSESVMSLAGENASTLLGSRSGLTLRGDLRADGLPYGDPRWQIRVSRFEDGVKKEDAMVDPQKGTYQINVASNSGVIRAELYDATTGEVLGSGSKRIGSQNANNDAGGTNKKKKTNTNDADGGLVIKKATTTIASVVKDFYQNSTDLLAMTSGRSKPPTARVMLASTMEQAQTDARGLYEFEHLQENSWGIVRTEAKGYYSGVYLLSATDKQQSTPLFSQKMINALKEIIKDQNVSSQVAENGSVVWGQVLHDEKPLAGAVVAAEYFEKHRVVYFNAMMLPDLTLSATSDNGYFAILNLPEGMHSLIATRLGAYLSHANVIADENTITAAVLQSTLKTEKVDLKVYDPFSGQPVVANIEMQSLEEPMRVDGFAKLDLSPIHRFSLMSFQAQDQKYADATYVYEDDVDSIRVPAIQWQWLKGLMGTKKLSELPGSGIIVGFVPFDGFKVKLTQEANFPSQNIVYFDAQGDVVENAVAGGGFIIYNVPPSVQTVAIQTTKTNAPLLKVVPVDASAVTVLTPNF